MFLTQYAAGLLFVTLQVGLFTGASFLVIGLAKHIDEVGRPLCPCNFYEDKAEEARSSRWVCACEEMQKYKYCH